MLSTAPLSVLAAVIAVLLLDPATALVEKLRWHTLAGTGDTVAPRADALLAANDTHVLIHGGYGPNNAHGNQQQDFVIGLNDGKWTRITRTGSSPVTRDAAMATYQNRGWVYGGYASSFNDNSLTTTLRRVTLNSDNRAVYASISQRSTGSRGSSRRNHAGVLTHRCNGVANRECLTFHGGHNLLSSTYYTDTRVYRNMGQSGEGWTRPGNSLTNNPGRSADAAFDVDYTGTGAVLFGGRTGNTASTATNNVYLWSTAGFSDRAETHGNIGTAANGKTARQSSDYRSTFSAARAIDGSTGSYRMSSNRCTHTRAESNPWLQIDLKRVYSISKLRIHNRRDCCSDRIRGFQVWVSDKPDIADVLAEGFLCPNPYDTITSNYADIPCITAGRYVTVRVPGNNKILSVCEVETHAARWWTWAQLSGTEEVAHERPTKQSSFSQTNFDNSLRAVDGRTSTSFSSGTCTHTRWEPSPWWYVDLLESREIQSVQIWERTDGCCRNRLSNFEIRVGFGSRWQDAQICKKVATITTTATYTCDTPLVGRSVFIVIPSTTNVVLTLCEVRVHARKLRNLPSPRFSHAHAAARGMVYYFGGVGSDGAVLNDFHVFDTYANEFRTEGALVGVDPSAGFMAPIGRAMGSMIVSAADSNDLVLIGGRTEATAGDLLIDAHKVRFRSCPSMQSIDEGVDTTSCDRGVCYYTCKAGYTDTNAIVAETGTQRPAVCTPDGFYIGANNIPFCRAPLPPKPTAAPTLALPVGMQEAINVSWAKVPDTSTMKVDAYRVRSVPSTYVDDFSGSGVLGEGWTFTAGGTQGNRFEYTGTGAVGLFGQAGTNCWQTNQRACSRILRRPPPALSESYTIETRVKFDSAYIKDNVFGGLVIWNERAGHHAVYWGIRRTGGVFQVNMETAGRNWVTRTITSAGQVSLRATFNAAESTWSFAYRTDDYDTLGRENDWIIFYNRLPASQIAGGRPPHDQWSVGPMIKTWGGTAKFWWDYIKIAPRDCDLTGSERLVDAGTTSAVVQGLSVGTDYRFTVQARSLNGGWGPESDASATLKPVVKTTDPWINVAYNKPTRQISTAYSGPSNQAVNDVTPFVPATSHYGCTHTWWHNTAWWTVDLEREEDIKELRVFGRTNCCQNRLWGFEIWIGSNRNSYNGEGNVRCPPDAVPYSWTNAENGQIPIRCGLRGQHVWIVNFNNFQTLCAVQVFAAARCPNDRASGGADLRSGNDCTSATSGSSCNARCPTGKVATAGSETSTCNMGEWSGAPLRCESACTALAAPKGAARCEHAIFREDFNDAATALRRFSPADPVDMVLDELFHAVDGQLVVGGDEVCRPNSVLLAQDEGVRGAQGQTLTRVRVMTDKQAGIAFRALNQNNMYAALLDFESFEHVVVVVQDGVTTELDRRKFAIRPQEWHTITADAQDRYVVITVDDSIQLFNVTSVHLANGASGIWALGSARFDDFSVAVPCLPGSGGSSVGACTNAAEHDTCSFACRSGFEPSGNGFRTCTITDAGTDAHAWTGQQFGCKIRPPIVRDANRTVVENAVRGTSVGAPVPAELEAEDEQMQFSIVAGNDGDAFKIDLCSGLITVHESAMLDFETRPIFTLTINVSVTDFPGSDASATVWIRLQDVDEAPIVSDAKFNVSEAAMTGTVVGQTVAYDQEGDEIGYEASFDQSEGILSVDRQTGLVTLDRAAASAESVANTINFERTGVSGPQLLMIVDAYQVNNTALRSSAFVTVDILDANDAPMLVQPQFITIDETLAQETPATIQTPVSAFDEDSAQFASALTFELVRDGASGKVIGNATTGSGTTTGVYLTEDGTATGADLITLDASNGLVRVESVPTNVASRRWDQLRPYLNSQGVLVRQEYSFRVRVSDNATDASGTSVKLSTVGVLNVVIDANITSEPIIDTVVPADADIASDSGESINGGSRSSLLRTQGGQMLNVTGRFLAGSGPVTAGWIAPRGSGNGFNLTSCTVISNDLIQCVSPSGWGTDLVFHMAINGRMALRSTDITLSYAPPLISSITGGDSLPTRGGGLITIAGIDLGPVGAPISFQFVRFSELQNALAGTSPWANCLAPAISVDSVEATCRAPAGAGRDLAWRFVVGDDPVNGAAVYGVLESGAASETLLSYAPPVLTAASISPSSSGGSLTALDTMGGEILRIDGDNFGPATASIVVSFSFAGDAPVRTSGTGSLPEVQLPLTACHRPVPGSEHSIMDCTVPAGVGTGLVINLEVEGQTLFGAVDSSGNSTNSSAPSSDSRQRLAYAGPVVDSVAGPGSSRASTRGGEQIVVRGRHFGTPSLSAEGSVEMVVYGPDRQGLFEAVDCRVTQSINTGTPGGEQVMSCLTAEGVGAGHWWQVRIASQTSPWNDANTNYGPPIVAAFSEEGATDADTEGQQLIAIQGSNFGPASIVNLLTGPAALQVEYSVLLTDLSTAALKAAGMAMGVGSTPDSEDGLRVNFSATDCSIVEDHTDILCTTAPGAGAALSWKVTIDSQTSQNPVTNYAPPQIDSIDLFSDAALTSPVAVANPNGGTWAILTGDFFGPNNATIPGYGAPASLLQWVGVGPSGREYMPATWDHRSHSQIVIPVPPGHGENLAAQVSVADQESLISTATFSYARPEVVALSPMSADTAHPTGSATPRYVVVEAKNLPLRDSTSAVVVLFGREGAGQIVILPTPFENEADAVAPSGNPRIRFALPPSAAGVDVPIRVGVVSASAAATATANGTSISPLTVTFASACDSQADGGAGAPACLFRFADPVIDSVSLTRPAWAVDPNRTDAIEQCPFDTRAPAVVCSSGAPKATIFYCPSPTFPNPRLRRVVLNGRSFGSAQADALMGTRRCLDFDDTAINSDGFDADEIFVSKWTDNEIIAYIRGNEGSARATITTPINFAGVSQDQVVQQQFQTESPSVSGREGATDNLATEGGDVISLFVPGLDKFTTVQVQVASNLPSPELLELYSETANAFSAAPVAHGDLPVRLGFGDEREFELRFRTPPGHGSSVRVLIQTNNPTLLSETAVTLSYRAPEVSSVEVGVVDRDTGAFSFEAVAEDFGRFAVRARTPGTFVRVRGTNLGPCPTAIVGAGAQYGVFSAADTSFCTQTPDVDTIGVNASWVSPNPPTPFDRVSACGSEPLHRCVIVPVPPGQGSGAGAGGIGYQILLSAGGQTPAQAASGSARTLLLSYDLPEVMSVAADAGSIPTRGGVPITISGYNFGELPPFGDPASTALAVRIGRRDRSSGATEAPFLWALDCASPQRMGHTMIRCTLPEGAGDSLDVEVTVAAQASLPTNPGRLSYSPPYVGALILKYNDTHEECVRTAAAASMPMAPGGAMPWPAACAAAVSDSAASPGALRLANIPAAGGVNVTVLGENFARRGLRVPLCVFATWQGAASSPICDDDGTDRVESFVGEGQLPPSAVFEHDHNMIKFQLPAGVGARRLDVLVGGARLSTGASARRERRSLATADATRPLLLAARPRVDLISPVLGTTRGGTEVLISGMHFGPDKALFNASVGGSALDGNRFVDPANSAVPRPISAALAVAAPTHYMIVHFGRLCVSNSALVPQSLGCSIGGVVSHADNGIVFRSPSGVGVNKAVRVEIVDAADASRRYPSAGPGVMFSYNPPRVITANPRTIMMRGDGARKRVEILGDDFGGVPPDPCTERTCWTDEEKELSLQIGAVHCVDSAGNPSATRKIEQGTTAVLCDLEPQLVGAKNLTLRIAGQSDFVTKQDVFRAVQMVCGVDAFGRPGESCMACPLGASCDGYVAELEAENSTLAAIEMDLGPDDEDPTPHTYPRPLTGFYNLNSSDSLSSGMLADCPFSNRIGSRDVCIVRCDPPWACVGDNFCGVGYASTPRYNFRCNDCAKGYYRRNNGNCEKCPDDPVLLIAVFIMIVIVASVLAYYLASKNIALFLPTVALDYFQILALFANSRATWPPFISDLLGFFSAFMIDINITAPECIAPNLGYTFRYGVTMALPVAAAALFGTLFVVNYLWARIIKRQTRTAACAAADTLIAMGLTGGYVLYVQLARTMFASLACSPNNPPEFDEAGNIIEYLQVVPEPCSKPGGVHQTLLPITVIGLLVYIAGYPAFVAYKLLSNRQLVVEDQLLRCKGVGDSESTNPHALPMRKRYSRIYYAFAPNFAPYWLHVLLMRKLVLAATALVFVRTPSWQLTLGLLTLFVAYAMQVRYRPWLAASDREKHLATHRVRALTPGSIDNKIASTIANAEHGLRKRSTFGSGLDASSARARAMQIGTVIYGSVLNNPNTFDSVLLTCGILVAIGGLLFESDRFASELPFYDSQRDSLAVVVGAVIIFGVIYAVVVIGLEFAALIRNSGLTQSQRAREAAKKAKDSKSKGEDSAGASGAVVGSSGKPSGPVDLMHNPMMMQKSEETDGRGLVVHTDAAADAIASITGKPDEQTWAIFKDAFLKLRAQVGELARTNVELERRYEAAAGRSTRAAAAGAGRRQSFSQVRAAGGPEDAPSSGKGGSAGGSDDGAKPMLSLSRAHSGRHQRTRSRSRSLLTASKGGAGGGGVAAAAAITAGERERSTSSATNPLRSVGAQA